MIASLNILSVVVHGKSNHSFQLELDFESKVCKNKVSVENLKINPPFLLKRYLKHK